AESGERPAAAAHGRQHAFRPKARSVLPRLPGLGLGPALGLRLRNEPGNETGRRGLWREDAAAIAIEDVVAAIAVQALRARVPVGGAAVAIDEKDRAARLRIGEMLQERFGLHGDGVFSRQAAKRAPSEIAPCSHVMDCTPPHLVLPCRSCPNGCGAAGTPGL